MPAVAFPWSHPAPHCRFVKWIRFFTNMELQFFFQKYYQIYERMFRLSLCFFSVLINFSSRRSLLFLSPDVSFVSTLYAQTMAPGDVPSKTAFLNKTFCSKVWLMRNPIVKIAVYKQLASKFLFRSCLRNWLRVHLLISLERDFCNFWVCSRILNLRNVNFFSKNPKFRRQSFDLKPDFLPPSTSIMVNLTLPGGNSNSLLYGPYLDTSKLSGHELWPILDQL